MSFSVGGWNMYKVMLVDDYEIFRMEIKRMNIWKDNPQFQIVAEASNGIEAIAFLEKNQVDVLITDIRMPQIDGIELLKIASERKLCPVVILLSDYTEYNYARQCLVHGAFDYYYSFIIDTYGSDKEMFIAIMKYTEQELRKKIIGDFPWIGLYYKESLGDLSVKIEEGINVVTLFLQNIIINLFHQIPLSLFLHCQLSITEKRVQKREPTKRMPTIPTTDRFFLSIAKLISVL